MSREIFYFVKFTLQEPCVDYVLSSAMGLRMWEYLDNGFVLRWIFGTKHVKL